MKLLVTGGAGYIGSVVAAQLIIAGHDVVVLDNLSTGHRDAVVDGAQFRQEELSHVAQVLDGSFDGVLHFAAKSLVAESVGRPEIYWDNNVVGRSRCSRQCGLLESSVLSSARPRQHMACRTGYRYEKTIPRRR